MRQADFWKVVAAVSCATVAVACARSGFDEVLLGDEVELSTWGGYTSTLDVPDCPRGDSVLTVNTTTSELDGGDSITSPTQAGAALSITEAIWISQNRAGSDTIAFDAAVFPASAPATIVIAVDTRFPASPLADVCVDGRERGVVIRWPDQLGACGGSCGFTIGPGSLVVGLTLLFQPSGMWIVDGQLAGCRINTDGYEFQTFSLVNAVTILDQGASVLGPGNVISTHRATGVGVWGSGGTIIGNAFGYDVLTGLSMGDQIIVDLDATGLVTFEDNEFAGATTTFRAFGSASRQQLLLRGNFAGVDRDGRRLPSSNEGASPGGFVLSGTIDATLGPNNVIRGVDTAIAVSSGNIFTRITENIISDNRLGIVQLTPTYGAVALGTPPTISAVTRTHVAGTCADLGWIEVFMDPGDQGAEFLGTTFCVAGAFALDAPLQAGQNVTATFTDEARQTSSFSTPVAVP